MLRRIINYFIFIKEISFFKFMKLNYFSKQIIRLDNSKIIPYKNVVFDLSKDCKIYLSKGDIELGCEKLKKSKAETLIRLRGNAIWCSTGGCRINYNTTIEVLNGAILNTKYFTFNSGSCMVVGKNVCFGKDVMIGRNVILYDNDFHQIIDSNKNILNDKNGIAINDHVWLTTNVIVLKGTTINGNSVIAANSTVTGNIDENSIYSIKLNKNVKENYGTWKR